jgi:hypothetical protein
VGIKKRVMRIRICGEPDGGIGRGDGLPEEQRRAEILGFYDPHTDETQPCPTGAIQSELLSSPRAEALPDSRRVW